MDSDGSPVGSPFRSPPPIKFDFRNPDVPGTPRAPRIVQIDLSDLENSVTEYVSNAVHKLREVELPLLIKEAIRPLQKEIQDLKEISLRSRIDKREMEEVKDNLVKLEGYSRRHNLKFFGIRENNYETKFDCKRIILQVLLNSNIRLHPKAIETAHRVGPKQHYKERPITVKFFHLGEKDLVLAKSEHIWYSTRIRIEEDYAAKIEADRKVLKPILTAASKRIDANGKREYSANLNMDKLKLNNKVYTVKNIQELPTELKPQNLATVRKNNITAFFTKDSPLSNHHLANQTIGKQVYNSNEQYFMVQKALTFGARNTAEEILKEASPGKQKSLGRTVHKLDNFRQSVWDEKSIDIMKTGIRAKFTQNPELKQFLLETGSTVLLEANPKDSFWGVGMSLKNPLIWTPNSWVQKATNHLGRLLHDLRRELKREQLEER